MTDHDHEAQHRYSPSPLFEERGDRMVSRGLADDRPYERIFWLKLWLWVSVLLNAALVIALTAAASAAFIPGQVVKKF